MLCNTQMCPGRPASFVQLIPRALCDGPRTSRPNPYRPNALPLTLPTLSLPHGCGEFFYMRGGEDATLDTAGKAGESVTPAYTCYNIVIEVHAHDSCLSRRYISKVFSF